VVEGFERAGNEAKSSFGDDRIFIEKFIEKPRHIEIQVLADKHGNTIYLNERECSIQRRHQKVIEEAPAPGMSDAVRQAMTSAAITAAQSIQYSNAGTIEFIVDGSGPLREDGFWFMEMNTRLQVEHPVTESITGFDLVEWQIRIAAGEPIPVAQSQIRIQAHSVEVRLYAEDPANGFLPVAGKLHDVHFSTHARVDTGVVSGDTITPFYDPMIAKIITSAENRDAAIRTMATALKETHIAGTATNLDFLSALVEHDEFVAGTMDTGLIEKDLEGLLPPEADTQHERMLACLILSNLLGNDDVKLHDTAGWRMWSDTNLRVNIIRKDQECTHRIAWSADRTLLFYENEHDDNVNASIQIQSITGNEIHYEVNGQRHSVRIVRWTSQTSGDEHLLLKSGKRSHTYRVANPLTPSGSDSINSDVITAPMTGVIRVVHSVNGDVVEEGDSMIVLEAMKMETTLVAPRNGTVANVRCTEGDAVSDGDMLIELEVFSEQTE